MKRLFAIALILVLFGVTACARQPSEQRSTKLIQKYFKKYGKKYPETIYGSSTVNEVDVTGQQEIHKHLVSVDAFLTLDDGTVQRIFATLEKGSFGWRFVSWENASGS